MAERAQIELSASDRTAAAFASAQRNLAAWRKSADFALAGVTKLTAGIGAIGLAVTSIDGLLNPRSVIDYADAINKLSQRTGIGAEALSVLDYQAKLADISTEELGDSLKKLNQNIAAAARGEKEQAEAFRLLGINVKDANGQIRGTEEILGDVAEKFSGYADGANKVALANAVGGKSFEKLIPLLNGGRNGFREAREELEKFGGVIGTDLARKSEQVNDNLTKLGVAANALKVTIAGGLIDSLVKLSNEYVEAAKNGTLLERAIENLKKVATGRATFEFVFGGDAAPDKLAEARKALAATTAEVERLQTELQADPDSNPILDALFEAEQRARRAADQVAALQQQAAGGVDPRREKDRTQVALPQAPALRNSTAQSDADAVLRRQLERRIESIQAALEREADSFAFHNVRLEAAFRDGETTIAEFYDAKERAQRDFLIRQQQGFEQEIEALRDAQKRLSKPQDREQIENQIEKVLQRQSKAQLDAGQAAEIAGRQRVQAVEEFRRSLVELDAQIADLQGDAFTADALRNAERLAQARRLLAQGGGDEARVQALERALRLQSDFAKLQEDVARASQRASLAEERFVIDAERAGKTREETERGVQQIRERSITQLDRLIAQTEELAKTSTDPRVLDFLEELRVARERAFDARDPGLLRFNELARAGGDTIAQSFTDAVLEGEKLGDVLDSLGKQLVRLVTEDLITRPLADSITNAIKSIGTEGEGGGAARLFSGIANVLGLSGGGGAGVDAAKTAEAAAATASAQALTALAFAANAATASLGGNAAGDVFSGIGGEILASIFHDGGVVGEGSRMRIVSPAAWADAPRYHSGGVVGEVPAILRLGEEVLTKADPRHRDNVGRAGRGGDTYITNVQVDGNVDRRTRNQTANETSRAQRNAARVA